MRSDPGPARALVVDDDDALLTLCARTLVAHGYRVEIARDAASALRAVRGTSFDGPRYQLEGVAEIGRLFVLDDGAKCVSPGGVEGRTASGENAAKSVEPGERSSALETTRDDVRTDPDDALKHAIKVAVDAGQFDRAAKLLDVLRATAQGASVVDLVTRRRP